MISRRHGILAMQTNECALWCSIGVIAEKEPPSEEAKQQKQDKEAGLGVQKCNVFGMEIKALTEDGEPKALDSSGSGDKAVEPNKVQQYLRRSFGTRYSQRHLIITAEIPLLPCSFCLPSGTYVCPASALSDTLNH